MNCKDKQYSVVDKDKVVGFQTLSPEINMNWILFYYAYQHAFSNKLMQSFKVKPFKIYEVKH